MNSIDRQAFVMLAQLVANDRDTVTPNSFKLACSTKTTENIKQILANQDNNDAANFLICSRGIDGSNNAFEEAYCNTNIEPQKSMALLQLFIKEYGVFENSNNEEQIDTESVMRAAVFLSKNEKDDRYPLTMAVFDELCRRVINNEDCLLPGNKDRLLFEEFCKECDHKVLNELLGKMKTDRANVRVERKGGNPSRSIEKELRKEFSDTRESKSSSRIRFDDNRALFLEDEDLYKFLIDDRSDNKVEKLTYLFRNAVSVDKKAKCLELLGASIKNGITDSNRRALNQCAEVATAFAQDNVHSIAGFMAEKIFDSIDFEQAVKRGELVSIKAYGTLLDYASKERKSNASKIVTGQVKDMLAKNGSLKTLLDKLRADLKKAGGKVISQDAAATVQTHIREVKTLIAIYGLEKASDYKKEARDILLKQIRSVQKGKSLSFFNRDAYKNFKKNHKDIQTEFKELKNSLKPPKKLCNTTN